MLYFSVEQFLHPTALDWFDELPSNLDSHFDLILISDCIFWPQLHKPLMNVIHGLSHENSLILLAATERLGTVKHFFENTFDMNLIETLDMPDVFAKMYVVRPFSNLSSSNNKEEN